ncbi:hypothetical protein M2138_002006 [Dysgonomonadaceae bacterium PH5-43]|nr:hypothetical protein [Dysgonomonadaceae bacterium PH5-43]
MKKFFKVIGSFFVFVLTIVVPISLVGHCCVQKNILNSNNFKIEDSKSILMIGDSHVGLSLDPQYINYSDNQFILGEHYLFTYVRLRCFLKNNPQLKTVVLGYTYSNLASATDNSLFNNYNKNASFPKYFALLNDNELRLLYASDLIYFRNFLGWKCGVPTKDNINLICKTLNSDFSKKELPFRGRYFSAAKGASIDSFCDAAGQFDFENLDVSEISVEYLWKIMDLCRRYEVKLILYTSPLFLGYLEQIPEFYKQTFEETTSKIKNDYPDVNFINYSDFVMPDTCYSDGNHLSSHGAKIVSEKLNEYLNSNKRILR